MGLGDAMKRLVGIEEEDYEEVTQEEIEEEKKRMRSAELEKPISKPAKAETPVTGFNVVTPSPYEAVAPVIDKGQPQSKSYSMNGSGPFKMLVIEPKNFDECTKLVDNLKSRKPVIINLEQVETDLARKMFDFLSGATYALNGNVQRVTANIFIFAPANVDIAAKLNRTDRAEPAPAKTDKTASPWK